MRKATMILGPIFKDECVDNADIFVLFDLMQTQLKEGRKGF